MKHSHIAVIEQDASFNDSFDTEPWEAGWADEARWYFTAQGLSGRWRCVVQLSPNGSQWCDSAVEKTIDQPGTYSFSVQDFGPWLRLSCTAESEPAAANHLFIYLALKG